MDHNNEQQLDEKPQLNPDEAVESIIGAVWRGTPAVIVPSPPGAGKSGTIERTVYAIAKLAQRRTVVACNTNKQVTDLVTRTAKSYPDLEMCWLARKGVDADELQMAFPNVTVVEKNKDIPEDIKLIFSTTSKLQYVPPPPYGQYEPFADLLVIDEAWQCPNVMFAQISWMAPRYLLVGDPGQIAPVTTVDVTRWRHRLDGPHRPAPVVILANAEKNKGVSKDTVLQIALPATRRFGQDTTAFVQPAFYPNLPFKSIRSPRWITYTKKTEPGTPESLLSFLGEGKEIVVGRLPGGASQQDLHTLAETAASLVKAAIQNGFVEFENENGEKVKKALTQKDVGVVCAHVAHVTSVQAALGGDYSQVVVDTAERWQGAECELVFVWDPMAGKIDLTDFSKDAGRMCVMLSRHRAGCVLLTQENVDELLAFTAAGKDRVLSSEIEDPSHVAWRSQTTLREALKGRTLSVSP